MPIHPMRSAAPTELEVSSENVIRIMCPNLSCQRVLAVPGLARGKIVRCRRCGMNIKIPDVQSGQAEGAPNDAAETPPAEKS